MRARTSAPRAGRRCAGKIPTTADSVIDPTGDGLSRTVVQRRVDLLERERAHKRISEAAYRAGRIVQSAFEAAEHALGSTHNIDDRVDCSGFSDFGLIERVTDHRAKLAPLFEHVRRHLGATDARIVRDLLSTPAGFAECANGPSGRGRSGERGEWYVATRFRDALESLAEVWAARGPARRTHDDAFAAMAANKVKAPLAAA